jgi:cytochrome c biogenesis protein
MKELLRFFSSVRLSVILLIMIAAGSFIGTVVVRFDVYHSLPFRILIGLLALNLVFCSLDRLPRVWRRLKSQDKNFAERIPARYTDIAEFSGPASVDDAIAAAEHVLSALGGRVKRASLEGSTILYTRRRAYAQFGPYLIHLAVLVIIIGGLIGSGFGFKGVVQLYEGERSDTAWSPDGKQIIPLGFIIQCQEFSVEYYESGSPRTYRTRLAVMNEHGEVEDERMIEVNHPWFYRGIGFYQQTWGQDRHYRMKATSLEHANTLTAELLLGQRFEIPDAELVFIPAMDLSEMRQEGIEIGSDIFVHVFFKDEFQGHLGMKQGIPKEIRGYRIEFERVLARTWTGLELVKDPGIPLIWAGFALLCLGLVFSFLLKHQRFWITVKKDGEKVILEFFGWAKREDAGLSSKVQKLKDALEEKLRKS